MRINGDSETEITIQQAADILIFSSSYVRRLLKEKKILFRKVGRHKQLLIADVLKYKEYLKKNRSDVVRFLTQEAQEMGLYDVNPQSNPLNRK